jgi:tRNA(Ile)-lysidine synthase
VSAADGPVSDAEADALFREFLDEPALALAISGGPDSTALLYLAARWRERVPAPPRLAAVTVDHGLRPEASQEADAVKRLAEKLGVAHRTMRWSGTKPSTGLQEKARVARYRLLNAGACRAGARFVLTAHTLDDQAETVLYRLARGSGLAGICGMARIVPISELASADRRSGRPFDVDEGAGNTGGLAGDSLGRGRGELQRDVLLVRPFLDLPKARLIVTLREAGITYADDPSNADPRFTRSRVRRLMPVLAAEGLTSNRLVRLAARVRRSEEAHEIAVNLIVARLGLRGARRKITVSRGDWAEIPEEVALRLLGRAIGTVGNEGPLELGKLEALSDALGAARAAGALRFRRTLAGAMVSLRENCIIIERAPERRHRPQG